VLTAIDFDDQMPLEADKIENEILKGHLAAEFEIRKAVIAEQLPNAQLSIGRLSTHLLGEVADTFGGRPMVRCLRHESRSVE